MICGHVSAGPPGGHCRPDSSVTFRHPIERHLTPVTVPPLERPATLRLRASI